MNDQTTKRKTGTAGVGGDNASDQRQGLKITLFTTSKGILTKRLSLNADGTVKKDSSGCCMTNGRATSVRIDGVAGFAVAINKLNSNQAIATGILRNGLDVEVKITTKKDKLEKFKDAAHIVARTGDYIYHRPQQPALALFDLDLKGIPTDVAARVADDFWEALLSVLPGLRGAARVVRRSTSAGLRRSERPWPRREDEIDQYIAARIAQRDGKVG